MDEEDDDNVGGLVPYLKRTKNSQGKDPRTFEAPVSRWRVQKKRKEKKWKTKKKKKKKHVNRRRSLWWTKCKEQFASLFVSERKEEDLEEKGRNRNKSPRTKQLLGRSGKWVFLLLILLQKWFCVDAAVGRLEQEGKRKCRKSLSCRMRWKALSWTWIVKASRRSRRKSTGESGSGHKELFTDRTEVRKEEKRLRCALLNGSAWSTEKKYMRRYKGTFDIFFGIEHRLRKEEMEAQLNREAKEGWRIAASAARITEETAGDEDRKHTSGGVVVAIDSNLGAVVGAEEGAIESIPGNEGIIAKAWVNVRGGLRIFARKDGRREMKHCWKQFRKELGPRSIHG